MGHSGRMKGWLLFVMQWTAIGFLLVNTVTTAATDHGVLMAINCFCLGIVVFSMLVHKLMARTIHDASEARDGFRRAEAMMMAAGAAMQDAINDGRVEVVPIQPFHQGGQDGDGPTRH